MHLSMWRLNAARFPLQSISLLQIGQWNYNITPTSCIWFLSCCSLIVLISILPYFPSVPISAPTSFLTTRNLSSCIFLSSSTLTMLVHLAPSNLSFSIFISNISDKKGNIFSTNSSFPLVYRLSWKVLSFLTKVSVWYEKTTFFVTYPNYYSSMATCSQI